MKAALVICCCAVAAAGVRAAGPMVQPYRYAGGGGGGGSDADADAYIARIANGSANATTITNVFKLLKDELPSYNLSGSLWSSVRAGFLGRSDCNAGTGTTLHDLTAADRDFTTSGVTWASTHISGGYLTRASPAGLLPTSAGAPFAVLLGLGGAYDSSSATAVVVGGNHNADEGSRFYLRDTNDSSHYYVREIGTAYWGFYDYGSGGASVDKAVMMANSGTQDKRYQAGGATATGTWTVTRTLGDDGAYVWRRKDGTLPKTNGRFYYLFCFDAEVSGADYAVLMSGLNAILGISLN